jgi:uncharacterized protein (DUF885 family)
MALYQLSALEQALVAVNRAADLAWTYMSGFLYFRMEAGAPLDGAIPDVSLEAAQRRADLGMQIQDLLAQVDDERLPHDYALTAKLVRYYASNWSQDAERYWLAFDMLGVLFYGPFAQTAYTGGFLFNYINRVFAEFSFGKDGDGERYLVLLADLVRMLRQMHARTEGQAQRGIRIHQPQLPAVRKLLVNLRANAATSYPVAAERLSKLDNAEALAVDIRRRVEQQILPAFDALTAQLDAEYESHAPQRVGMCELPGGKEVYADLVRMHTTMDLTPEQVHAKGHARMARIEAQMAQVRQQLGFNGDAAEFAVNLRKQPGAVAAKPEDIGEKMRKHKGRIEARFDEFFAQRSAYECDLVRLPEALEGSMTWGYYGVPSGSEKRGLYHYNGSKLDSQAVIGAASLVFHELVPGHHLHMTLQQDNPNLPPVRKHAMVNAFNEGWAEYAATLTGEMGLYDDPYDLYGRLVFDAFLTSRLVVDTGMNFLGWSWEQAKEYMCAHTLATPGEIESDTLRYSCGIPAQALAYKLGDEEILRMRKNVQERLKGAFHFRDFHSAILGAGGIPLPALEWHLDKVFPAAGEAPNGVDAR